MTTISGTVYDPAGKRPVYGAVAYVPSTTPEPVVRGAACYSCADLYSGDPVASAVTDAGGNFRIMDAPDGTSIPLVVQVGKWRRQFVLPSVARCASTLVPDRTLTLPRNGGEGDLPNIAISTGGGDSLECLLRRMGVDDSEYVAGAGGDGHLHIFKGNDAGPDFPAPDMSPGAPDSAVALWGSITDMMRYDMVLLSCEGYPRAHPNQQVMFDYAASGGRVFASHSHYAWFDTGPFGAANLAAWTTGTHQGGTSFGASIVTTTWASQPFPRGQAFADWLLNVDALMGNELPIESPSSYNAYVTAANTPSQPWIVANNRSAATLDLSFDAPLGAAPADWCGRVAFADMHAGPGAGDYASGAGKITPTGCAGNDSQPPGEGAGVHPLRPRLLRDRKQHGARTALVTRPGPRVTSEPTSWRRCEACRSGAPSAGGGAPPSPGPDPRAGTAC